MIAHFIWCHLLIVRLELGMIGAALATNITFSTNIVLADIILAYHPVFKKTRASWSRNLLFTNWGSYLQIGLPCACMICFEWWAFELLAIFSGYISVAALAAEVVIINMVSFIFMMPLGISFAASALTGYYIGRNNIPMAKRFAHMTMLLNLLLTLVVLALIILFSNELSNLFT